MAGAPCSFLETEAPVSKFLRAKPMLLFPRISLLRYSKRCFYPESYSIFKILMTREKLVWPQLDLSFLVLIIKCALLFSGAFLWLDFSSDQCCFRWAKYCKCSPVSASRTIWSRFIHLQQFSCFEVVFVCLWGVGGSFKEQTCLLYIVVKTDFHFQGYYWGSVLYGEKYLKVAGDRLCNEKWISHQGW